MDKIDNALDGARTYMAADIAAALDKARTHLTAGEEHLARGDRDQSTAEFIAGGAWAALASAEQQQLTAADKHARERACPTCRGTRSTREERTGCCQRLIWHWHALPCHNPVHA